jgi:hypothetical protein
VKQGASVSTESNDLAFRAQLVLPGQKEVYEYWLKRCGQHGVPCRADFNPCDLPRLLPNISLINVSNPLENSTVRLAGTRYREIYDREITGLSIKDLDWDEKRAYWLEAYRRTVDEQLPTQGVIRGPRKSKDHVVQYWLRLPLRIDSDDVRIVLCYDHFAPVSTEATRIRYANTA